MFRVRCGSGEALLLSVENKSETLFVAICRRHGYEIERLNCRSDEEVRTADFEVRAPKATFIAEVKELAPNATDMRIAKELQDKGYSSVAGGGEIGLRARAKIRQAADQLKTYRAKGIPLLVVLYDNSFRIGGRTLPLGSNLFAHQIDAAMYGHLIVTVQLQPGGRRHPDRSGGRRTLTSREKTYISAVAVISCGDDETLQIYHNCFARIKFPADIFTDSRCFHFEKRGEPFTEPWKWHELAELETK